MSVCPGWHVTASGDVLIGGFAEPVKAFLRGPSRLRSGRKRGSTGDLGIGAFLSTEGATRDVPAMRWAGRLGAIDQIRLRGGILALVLRVRGGVLQPLVTAPGAGTAAATPVDVPARTGARS